MFMANNRKLNGAANPGDVAASDAALQREQETSRPNDWDGLGAPQHRTFQPDLETIEVINARRKLVSVDGDLQNWPEYSQHMPLGPQASGDQAV